MRFSKGGVTAVLKKSNNKKTENQPKVVQEKNKRKYESNAPINAVFSVEEFNNIGGIKSDKELQKLQNETLTRKKQADLEEKINNVKLDKKKLYEKKSIMIPKFIDISSQYYQQIDKNKQLMQQEFQNYKGYKRQFYVDKKKPNPSVYDADEIDIQFLQNSLKKIPNNKLSQKELCSNQIVQCFEKCIEMLDHNENLEYLQKNIQKFNIFSLKDLESIYFHWQKKCKKFKRPLLRIYWKSILVHDKYGKYDKLKKAFHQREKPKYKQQRKVNKMSPQQVLDILQNLYKENMQGFILASYIREREELKLLQFKLELTDTIDDKDRYIIKQHQKKIQQLQNRANKYFITQVPQPQVQPTIRNTVSRPQKVQPTIQPVPQIKTPVLTIQQPQMDFDLQCLMATIISSLKKHNFSLKDFYTNKIDQINHKIKNANSKQKILLSNSKKEVNMGLTSKQLRIKSPNSIFLVKKQSIINPSENFIVKLTKEDIAKGRYDISNFTFDNIANKHYQKDQNEYSHGRLIGYVKQNPYVYCQQSNLNFTDNYTETLKVQWYKKFLDGVDMELIDQNPLENSMVYKNIDKTAEESLTQRIQKEQKKDLIYFNFQYIFYLFYQI